MRLTKDREFKRVYRDGTSYLDGLAVVYLLENGLTDNRIGFSVGKKMGGAVDRNRVRRMLREAYRAIESNISLGFDIVIIPRARAREARFHDVVRSLERMFRKSGLWEV